MWTFYPCEFGYRYFFIFYLFICRGRGCHNDHIVAAIKESKDLSKLTLVELMGSLKAHEARMKRFEQPLEQQAFQSKINISKNDRNKKNNRGGAFTNPDKKERKTME